MTVLVDVGNSLGAAPGFVDGVPRSVGRVGM